MRIATKLKLAAWLPALIALVIALCLYFSYRALNRSLKEDRDVQRIVQSMHQLNNFAQSYLLHHNERPRQQFLIEHGEVTAHMAAMDFRDAEKMRLLAGMRHKSQYMMGAFLRLAASYERGAGGVDPALVQVAAERLAGPILIKSRSILADAQQLEALVHGGITRTQQGVYGFAFILVVAIALLLTTIMLRMMRSINRSLRALRQGTEIVAGGDLQHRIHLPAGDEIGELSRAFDLMTGQLQETTVSREALGQEVEERRRIEEMLRSSEQRLAKENREIELAGRMLRIFVEQSGDALYDRALAVLMEGLASRHGVFGYIDEEKHLICPSMTKMLDECEIVGKCIHYPPEKWKGLWARSLLAKTPLMTNTPAPVPAGHPYIANNLASPILFQGEVIGLFNLANKDGGYTEADRELLEGVAARIAPVLYAWIQKDLREKERRVAEASLLRGLRRFELLAYTAGELLASREPLKMVESLCRRLMECIDCHAFFNYLADEETGRLHLNAWAGIPAAEAARIEWLDYGLAVCGCVARDGERIVAERIAASSDERLALVKSFGIDAYCCHPIPGPDGSVLGTLSFGTRGRETFSEDDLALMKAITDQVAVAMIRMRDQQDLQRSRDELERRVEERTEQLRHRADQLARLASELTLTEQRERRRLAQVLHDHLQQLLVGAKFGLEVLGRRLEDDQRSRVEKIMALLNDSIHASRSLTMELSPPILHEAGLAESLEWLVRWMREKHGLEVELLTNGEADSYREDLGVLVFQAVRELLFNVVKHAGVTRARVELVRREDACLEVTVSDAGKGFRPDDLWSRTRPVAGGFGLLSIRERVLLMGGRLDIASEVNKGARFTLVVPVDKTGATATAASAAAMAAGRTAASGPDAVVTAVAGNALRVLLVDDHAIMRQGIALLLEEEEDIEIVGEAADGEEALQKAREMRPDVVLMDFSMPAMDGIEATKRICAEMPGIRVIGLSMYEEEDRAAAMIDAGAVGYVSKSAKSARLLAVIREHGSGGRGGASHIS